MSKTIHTDAQKALASKLKEARRKSNFTQMEVAEKLGYKQPYISKIEAGEVKIDVVELQRFAKIYKKDFKYFLS